MGHSVTQPLRNSVTPSLGNYLTRSALKLGNCMTADRRMRIGEVALIAAGTRAVTAAGHGELQPALIAAVVGLHFLPFAWAFQTPEFGALGLVPIAVAAVATVLGATDVAVPALVAGVGAGFVLLGFAALLAGGTRSREVPQTSVVG